MSIRLTVRVAAPSIIISLLLLTVGSVGGWIVQRLQRSTAQTVSLDMSTIQAAEQLVFAIGEMRMELAQFLATGDRGPFEGRSRRLRTDRAVARGNGKTGGR